MKQTDSRPHCFGKRSAIMAAAQVHLNTLVVQIVLRERSGSESIEYLVAIDRLIDQLCGRYRILFDHD